MNLRFKCPQCGKSLKSDVSLAGGQARCTGCGATVDIPRWQGEPPPEPGKTASAAGKTKNGKGKGSHTHPPIIPPTHANEEDLIDMTAMVDIVFFLLIFFLVTSLQALEAVMDLPSPQAQAGAASKAKSAAELEADPEFITVRIEDDDSMFVDEEEVFGDADLRIRLRRAKDEADTPRGVSVVGDADASHGAAVMVFDACMAVGLEDIRLTVQESAESPAGG
jgi:biopolymer transport protein ExbD